MSGARVFHFVFGGALIFSATGYAQDVSDLMPAPAGGPGGGYWVPGRPLPTPGTQNGTNTQNGTTPASAPPSRNGYLINDNTHDNDYDSGGVTGGRLPDVHVVKKGETLWEISRMYFNNAWLWPKLWSYNPDITNPHWIYPGDAIRLAPERQAAAPAPAAEEPTRKLSRAGFERNVFLRQTGFVEPGELQSSGKVIGSPEEKEMLATLDDMYVEFKSSSPLRVGERYTVFNPTRTLKHPQTHKKLGEIVEIYGEVEVKSVTDANVARVTIVDAVNPIARGMYVGPLRRQFRVLKVRPSAQDLSGELVGTLDPIMVLSQDNLVFIDKGRNDGVQVGNRAFVVRRGDGYVPRLSDQPLDNKKFPREDIAEVIVVDLRDNMSFGFITKGKVDARVGDRIEMRKGQ